MVAYEVGAVYDYKTVDKVQLYCKLGVLYFWYITITLSSLPIITQYHFVKKEVFYIDYKNVYLMFSYMLYSA